MPTAVVIGSGVGGLTSALLLGQRGYQVTLLEQHERPGGMLQRFFRRGVGYDTGFHYCGGIGPDDALGRCLAHLGVRDRIHFLPLDPDGFDRLVFPSLTFDVPVGVDRYRDRLVECFPHEQAGIERFIRELHAAVDEYGLYRLRAPGQASALPSTEGVSLGAVLQATIRDPMCRHVIAGQGILYGVPADDAPFGLHCLILHHFLRGAHRIDGGGDRIALQMVKAVRRQGGTVRLGEAVTRILVHDRVAQGVQLASGEQIRADLVVANLHPVTAAQLLPDGAVRPAYLRRIHGNAVGMAHQGVYIEMDGPVPELGNRNLYRHLVDDARSFHASTPDDLAFYYASAPAQSGGSERLQHNVILMLTAAPFEAVGAHAGHGVGARPAAYHGIKDRWQAATVGALLRDFPQLEGRIRRIESSTPLTTLSYTSSPRGAMYGHYHSVEQMGRNRPAQAIRTRNLVLVGQGVFTPGILGSMLSAYYGIGRVVGLESLVQELRAA